MATTPTPTSVTDPQDVVTTTITGDAAADTIVAGD
jgi:hypothetical protein